MPRREERAPEAESGDQLTNEEGPRRRFRLGFPPTVRVPTRTILVLLFFGLVTCIFFFKVLFSPEKYHIPYDIGDYHYPLAHEIYEGLRTWELPLWDPYPYAGMPLAGNINAQVFYPPTLVTVKLSDWLLGSFPYRVLEYQLVLHYLLAALGAYLLARSFGLARYSSLMGGLVFAFGGFFASQMQHLGLINGAAWVPFIFYFLKRSIETRGLWPAVPGGIALAMAILAGFPALFMLTLLTLGLTAVAVAIALLISRDFGTAGVTMVTLALMVVISLGLSAIQILPAAELNAVSVAPEQHEGIGGIPRAAYLTLLLPRAWGVGTGEYWGGAGMTMMYLYVGITPLVLAALCLVAPAGRRVFLIAGLASFSLVWAMGEALPVAGWIAALLPASVRGGLYNFFGKVFFDLGVALLAAFGLQRLCHTEDVADGLRRSGKEIMRFLAFLTGGLVITSFVVLIAAAGTEFGSPARARLLQTGESIVVLIVIQVLIGVLVFLRLSRRIGRVAAAGALLLLTTIELIEFGAAKPFNIYPATSTSPNTLSGNPKPIEFLRSDADFRANRHMRIDVISRGGRAWHTMCRLWGIENANGDDPLLLKDYYALRMLDSTTDGERRFMANDPASPLLDLLGVKYMVVYDGNVFTPPAGFELKVPGTIKVYQRPSFLPRAFLSHSAQFFGHVSILERIRARNFSADTALLEGSPRAGLGIPTRPEDAPAFNEAEVRILSHRPNVVTIATDSPHPGFLVLTDGFCPGWIAEVNGKSARIHRAYGAFRAVKVPAGKQEVVFRYRPRSVLFGALITGLTVLAIVLGVTIPMVRRRRAKPNQSTF